MYRISLCAGGLVLGMLATLPGNVQGQAKNPKVTQATAQDYFYLGNVKSISAQLLSFDDSARTITVRIDVPEWVPNPNFKSNNNQYAHLMQHQNHLAAEQAKLAAAKTPTQVNAHMRQIAHLQNLIAQDMARLTNVNPNNLPFKVIQHQKDFDLDLQENIVYRKMSLPQEYDDTGNLKTYSKEKIAELKGKDSTKPGYSATASEFHSGQYVGVYLTPPKKKASSSSSSSSSSAKDSDKDARDVKGDDSAMMPEKPTVRMLIIMQEGTAPTTTNPPPKKKN